MAANIYNPVPVPIGDGTGAPVSIIGQGLKTFVIGGIFDATVIIEAGIGGNFAPLYVLDKPNQFRDVPVIAEDIRVRVVNHRSGQATVIIGGAPLLNTFSPITVPAGNGVGPALDTSAFGHDKTLIAGGVFDATLTVEVSEDAAGPFAPLGSEGLLTAATFDKTANILNIAIVNRFIRVRVTNYKSGTPFVSLGAGELATGGGAGAPYAVMYQPGGPGTGPCVFSSWASTYAAILAIRVAAGGDCPILLAIDDSFTSPAVIPAGTFDMTNVTLTGSIAEGPSNGFRICQTATDCFLPGLRRIKGNGNFLLQNASLTTSPVSDFSAVSAPYDVLINEGGYIESVAGGAPVFDFSLAPPGNFFIVITQDFGQWGQNGNRPVIGNIPDGVTVFLNSTNGGFWRNSVSGTAAAFLIDQGGAKIWTSQPQPNFLGTISRFNLSGLLGPSREMGPNLGNTFANPAVAPVAALRNRDAINYYDASGGAIVQPLRLIGNATDGYSAGNQMTFVEVSGNPGLSLVAPAGQTLNGVVAGSFNVPAGGSVLISNDGVNAYSVMGVYDPTEVTGAGEQTVLVYRELGPVNGPVIFNVWDDLYRQILLIRAATGGLPPIDVCIDQTDNPFPAANNVPFTGAFVYDMTNVTLKGIGVGSSTLDFADGTSVVNMFLFKDKVFVRNRNTVTPLCSPTVAFAVIEIDNFSGIESINGGSAFYDVSGTTSGCRITCGQFSGCGQDVSGQGFSLGPIVVGAGPGQFLQLAGFDINRGRPPFSGTPLGYQGVAGALLILILENAVGRPASFPGFAGTIFAPQVGEPAVLSINPWNAPSAIAPVSASFGQSLRLDASGGPIAQLLPIITGASFPDAGGMFAVVETSGTVGATIGPAGADTLRGLLTAAPIPAGGGLLLQSDGQGNWDIIATFDPAVNSLQDTLVFQPGGLGGGPVLFATWPNLIAQLTLMRSVAGGNGYYPIEIEIDDSIVTPAVIPAGGPYDLTDVTLIGRPELGAFGANTRLDLADGATFIGMRSFRRNLGVVGLGTAVADSSLSGSETIDLDNSCFINTPIATGVAIWDAAGVTAADILLLQLGVGSFLNFNFGGGLSNGPVINMPTAGSTIVVNAREGSGVPFVGITGIVGTVLFIQAASTRNIPNVNTGFLGTVVRPASTTLPSSLAPNPWYTDPINVAAIPVGSVRPGGWYRFDASGGPIAQSVPGISGFANNYKQPGVMFGFTEEGNAAGLTLVPAGGDTINGVAGPFTVPPNAGVLCMGDGVSDTRIIAVFDPTLAPPSELVYQPGGVGIGPVVFSSWTAVNSRLAIIKAIYGAVPIDLVFDDSIVSPIPIPVGGPYDMSKVTWTGGNEQGIGVPVFITIPEGVTFTGLREFGGFIRVTNLATATIPDTSLADGDNITVGGAAHIESTGLVPIWRGTGLVATDVVFVVVQERGALGFNLVPTAPFVDVFAAGTVLVGGAFGFGLIREDSLAGPAGAVLFLAQTGSGTRVRADQATTFLGTISQTLQQFTRFQTDQTLTVASPDALSEQRLARYDTTAGNIIANLPAVNTGDMYRGQVIAAKNEVGTNTVIITPPGADTIDSVAAPLTLYPGQGAILSWDGVSNWTAFHVDNNGAGKHLFITAASQSPQTQGDHIGSNVGVNGSGNVEFHIPDDFNTLLGAQVLVISGGTDAAADIDLNSDYGGVGDLFNANSESDVASTFALVINQINEIDISTVLTGVASDDTVGVELSNNNVTGGYLVLGIHLSYL